YRMQQLVGPLVNYTNTRKSDWFRDGKWSFPDSVLRQAVMNPRINIPLTDAWGEPIKLIKREKKMEHGTGWSQFDFYELVSAGPDRKFGTADDVTLGGPNRWFDMSYWWLDTDSFAATRLGGMGGDRAAWRFRDGMEGMRFGAVGGMAPPGGFGGGGGPRGAPAPAALMMRPEARDAPREAAQAGQSAGGAGAAAPVTRVREYFPETMLWQPALITDEQGRASLPVSVADSI